MALVNPQIAMSVRPTVEYQPRNALAEYAQLQQIVGGQRQAEVADMQIEDLRRERDVLGQISAAISAKGGPDIKTASLLMMRNPRTSEQGFKIYQALQQQERLDAYERGEGLVPGAAPAPAPAPGAILGGNAMAAPAAAAPAPAPAPAPAAARVAAAPAPAVQRSGAAKEIFDEYGEDAARFFEEKGYFVPGAFTRLADQPRVNPEVAAAAAERAASLEQFVKDMNAEGARFRAALNLPPAAPAPAGATNVLAAQQGVTPPRNVNQFAAAGATPNIDDLRRRYNLASRAGSPDAAVFLKQIEEALQSSRSSETTRKMRELGIPITEEGFARFSRMSQPQVRPRVDVIGVSTSTNAPVFFDEDASQMFTIGTDAAGKQVRVPYTGGINRSTSNVTATATAAGSRLESAEQKGKGELNVKQYGDVATAARLAARTLPAMETQAKILDQGFTTGFGTEVKKAGASVLAALGVKEAEKFATDAQTFLAATQQAVLQKQLEQKGVQTQADADRITQTGAQFGNTVAANRFIIDVAKAQLQRDIAQRNFYDDWWSNKKTYEGAENAWYAGEGGKSLFERPELKKYLTPPGAAAAQIPAGAPAAAAPAQAIPQAAIDRLKAGQGTDAQFDAIFGAGAAKRVRGQ